MTDGDQQKLARALSRLADEIPSLTVSTDSMDGRVVLGVMSESQLESMCDQFSREYKIEFLVDEPRVIYLETIRRTSEAEGRYIRQVGGHGNYGHVKLRLEPGPRGAAINSSTKLPKAKSHRNSLNQSTVALTRPQDLAFWPATRWLISVPFCMTAAITPKIQTELAFRFAGSIAFKEAARKASPIVLEPVMSVEAEVPEKYLSSVVREMNDRRGRIEGVDNRNASVAIQATIPLAELLQSSARGRPAYPMRFAGYEPAPHGGWGGSDGSGVTANKPEGPRTRGGVASAWPEAEPE